MVFPKEIPECLCVFVRNWENTSKEHVPIKSFMLECKIFTICFVPMQRPLATLRHVHCKGKCSTWFGICQLRAGVGTIVGTTEETAQREQLVSRYHMISVTSHWDFPDSSQGPFHKNIFHFPSFPLFPFWFLLSPEVTGSRVQMSNSGVSVSAWFDSRCIVLAFLDHRPCSPGSLHLAGSTQKESIFLSPGPQEDTSSKDFLDLSEFSSIR
jgi:hypothetical protein